MRARELALDLLLEVERTGAYAGNLIRETLEKYDYEDPREKAFFKRLTESTLEHGIAVDWALNACSKVPVERMKPLIRALLRLSACQILFLENVPDRAVCDEAVKLAKKRGFSQLSGFVNGVLRTLIRKKGEIALPDAQNDPQGYLSVRYSMPRWLIALWEGQYGQERTKTMLEALEERRPVTIRFCRMTEEDEAAAAETIRKSGVSVEPHPFWPRAWELGAFSGAASLPGYREGLFYIQDAASMMAVAAAGIRPGMRVLDLCSAPGGKTVLAAEYAGETGVVRAGDLSEKRLLKTAENTARMGLSNVEIRQWDARVFQPDQEEWADVLLADLPCSGLGVIGRKKDIRYRIRPSDLADLAKLQREILSASWRYVKKGGILLYSTCTVNRGENEETVRFLTKQAPFLLESLDFCLPDSMKSRETAAGMLQLFPGQYHTDGFFMARLRRMEGTDDGYQVPGSFPAQMPDDPDGGKTVSGAADLCLDPSAAGGGLCLHDGSVPVPPGEAGEGLAACDPLSGAGADLPAGRHEEVSV